MPKTFAAGPTGNRLLDLLPASEYAALKPHLRQVELKHRQVLYEPRAPITQICLPISAILSAITVMRDGRAIEVATTGYEGVSGVPCLDMDLSSPHRVVAQVAGLAWQADAAELRRLTARLPELRGLLGRHHLAFLFQVSQSIACNGLHLIIQRCARWLLMTHDRVAGDDLALTHEYLAIMLGVRRSGVTQVLQALQQQGSIRYGRGMITVLDREGLEELACECYQDVRDEYARLLGF